MNKQTHHASVLRVMGLETFNLENLSIIIRFLRNALLEEHLIGLVDLSQLNAEYITTQILNHLQEGGYSIDNIISQCYDDAVVMSGVKAGVQGLLQKTLGRDIP